MTAQEASDQQIDNPLFVCTSCGEAVVVYGGQFFRTCEHVEALVAATYDGLKAASYGIQ
jgi:hypothetical protein